MATLRDLCIDWNGEPIADGSTPRYAPRCGDIRAAADQIERLYGLVKVNNALARMNGEHRDEWRAKAVARGEALEAILHTYDDGGVPLSKAFQMANRALASGIEARSDETAQQAQPEGQEPGPQGDAQKAAS